MNYETNLENSIDMTIENKTNIDQVFRYYGANFTDVLHPGDKIKLTVSTAESLVYYTEVQEELKEDETPISAGYVFEIPDALISGSYLDVSSLDFAAIQEATTDPETGDVRDYVKVLVKQSGKQWLLGAAVTEISIERNAIVVISFFTDLDYETSTENWVFSIKGNNEAAFVYGFSDVAEQIGIHTEASPA